MSCTHKRRQLPNPASLAWLLASLCISGCGGDAGPRRAVVSGAVTYQGRPVDEGEIRFTPIKDTVGPVTLARIANGRYDAAAKDGVPVGTHQVQILAYLADPNARPEAKGTPGERPRKQYLPAKYNTQSTLECVVETGQGEIRKDFQLQ
jgi:hypothetical protein